MKVKVVTALFDIKRDINGDGRKIDEYLNWFKKTLLLKCEMVIYTEEKFVDFISNNRLNGYDTKIIVQKLNEIPFYKWCDKIETTINSSYYKSRMKDTSRIECYLTHYNLIQYSKFGWLRDTTEYYPDYDFFFWMDAGCSRFFEDFNLDLEWPNSSNLFENKLIIQGNYNFTQMFEDLIPDDYMWENNCVLVGTLFGGDKNIIVYLEKEINKIFEDLLSKGCVNNEQFALAIFAKKNLDLMNIFILINDKHLPLFNILGEQYNKELI